MTETVEICLLIVLIRDVNAGNDIIWFALNEKHFFSILNNH